MSRLPIDRRPSPPPKVARASHASHVSTRVPCLGLTSLFSRTCLAMDPRIPPLSDKDEASQPAPEDLDDTPRLSHKRSSEQSSSELRYPRKRSVRACHLCRARKTKCDNVQPTCGFCASIGANCSYDGKQTDHSSYAGTRPSSPGFYMFLATDIVYLASILRRWRSCES